MQHIKRLLSALLITALVFTAAIPAAAASFSDIDGHWAESYMLDLNKRGYLSGYTDGTMKPEGAITACEALVFLSRFYSLEDEDMEYLYDDYGDTAEKYVPKTHSWAYEGVAICLAAEIISSSELREMKLTEKIEKELLSVLLVRVLELEDDASDFSVDDLEFLDKEDIDPDYCGHIAQLVDIDIITGDDNNNFTPNASVTRAMAATLVSRGLDYLDDEDVELEIEDYTNTTRLYGILTSVSAKTIQVRSFDGLLKEFTLTNDTAVLVNGSKKTLSATYENSYVELSSTDGKITKLAITSDDDVEWIQGKVSSVATAKTGDTVTIRALIGDSSTKVKIPEDAKITLDGKSSGISKLNKGLFAILKIEDKVLENLYAINGDLEFSGKVSSIAYSTTIQFKVQDKAGTIYVFPLDVTDLPTVKRGDRTITIDRLAVGDEVTVTVESTEIKTIETKSTQETISGVLSSTTTTTSGTYWTLMDEDGDETTYQLDNLASAYNGTKSILITDIQIGDTVSIVIYGNMITDVELVTAISSADKLTVSVLAVDKKTITALYNSKLIYIDASDATIISAITGQSVKVTALTSENVITAYGNYTSTTVFEATSIIVER